MPCIEYPEVMFSMVGCVILGMLAAFGLLCALWAAFGWLLPGFRGCVLVCFGQPEAEIFTKYKCLRGLGLLDCPFLVVCDGMTEDPELENCTGEALLSRLEMERNRFDGTGNGDHSGRHRRRDFSEL